MSAYSRGYDAVRVGILGLLAVVAFTGLFLFVTNRSLAHGRTDIYVRLPIASGLASGDPVRFRGVGVGEVKKISFDEAGDVIVFVRLLTTVPLTRGAHAEMVPVDLFGRQSLVLLGGEPHAAVLATGDTIPGVQPPSMSEQLGGLGVRAERLMGDTMITLLHETLAGSAAAARQVAELGSTMTVLLAAQQQNISRLTEHAALIAQNVGAATEPTELIAARSSIMQATARVDTATMAIASMLGALQNGEGSAGRLLRDTSLVVRTEELLISMEALARDLKTNPKRYINFKLF